MNQADDRATIARLTERLEEALETIRQLRETFTPPRPVQYRGLQLTWIEGAVLEAFYKASPSLLDRGYLRRIAEAASSRSTPERIGEKWADTNVARLRFKLRTLDPPVLISTVYGAGYFLDETSKARLAARRIEPGTQS